MSIITNIFLPRLLLMTQMRGCIQHESRLTWLFGKHHIQHHEFQLCNYGQPWVDWLAGTEFSYQQRQQLLAQQQSLSSKSRGNEEMGGAVKVKWATTVIPWTIPALFLCVAWGSAYL